MISSTAISTSVEHPAFAQKIMGRDFRTVRRPLDMRLAMIKVETDVLCVMNPERAPHIPAIKPLSVNREMKSLNLRLVICFRLPLTIRIPTKNSPSPPMSMAKDSKCMAPPFFVKLISEHLPRCLRRGALI